MGQAQIDAGADALTFPDHATGDLVSGEYYKRFLQDIHSQMVDDLPSPLILHICGKTIDRMPYIAKTGMASFHFDSKNDPQEAMDAVNGGIGLVGNINNPETLYATTIGLTRSAASSAAVPDAMRPTSEAAIASRAFCSIKTTFEFRLYRLTSSVS